MSGAKNVIFFELFVRFAVVENVSQSAGCRFAAKIQRFLTVFAPGKVGEGRFLRGFLMVLDWGMSGARKTICLEVFGQFWGYGCRGRKRFAKRGVPEGRKNMRFLTVFAPGNVALPGGQKAV